MKIYTKRGDTGETDIIGKRVKKYNLRVEAYGTVDEAISYIGVLESNLSEVYKEEQRKVMRTLFDVCSELATTKEDIYIKPEHITFFEERIDAYEKELPMLKNFILPGGSEYAAHAHVIRTIIRRAERMVVELSETEDVREELIQLLNRISDYYFVFARFINKQLGFDDITK